MVSGETHYKAVVEAAPRVRQRSFDSSYRIADVARWPEEDPPGLVSDNQGGCNHDSSLSGLNSYGNVRYSWAVGLGGS